MRDLAAGMETVADPRLLEWVCLTRCVNSDVHMLCGMMVMLQYGRRTCGPAAPRQLLRSARTPTVYLCWSTSCCIQCVLLPLACAAVIPRCALSMSPVQTRHAKKPPRPLHWPLHVGQNEPPLEHEQARTHRARAHGAQHRTRRPSRCIVALAGLLRSTTRARRWRQREQLRVSCAGCYPRTECRR